MAGPGGTSGAAKRRPPGPRQIHSSRAATARPEPPANAQGTYIRQHTQCLPPSPQIPSEASPQTRMRGSLHTKPSVGMAAPAKALGKGQQAPQVSNRSTPSETAETDVLARDGDCQNSLGVDAHLAHLRPIQPQNHRPPRNSAEHGNQRNRCAGMGKRTSPAVRLVTRQRHRCQAPKQKSLAAQRMRGFFSIKPRLAA